MRSIISAVVMSGLFAAGCAARVGYSATVSSDGYGPDLVYVAPGVQVIADFDEPIFYADGLYWRFYSGTWYRSRNTRAAGSTPRRLPWSCASIGRTRTSTTARRGG